jgi:cytochrome c-type biogenesis protein CcmH/NrfF
MPAMLAPTPRIVQIFAAVVEWVNIAVVERPPVRTVQWGLWHQVMVHQLASPVLWVGTHRKYPSRTARAAQQDATKGLRVRAVVFTVMLEK